MDEEKPRFHTINVANLNLRGYPYTFGLITDDWTRKDRHTGIMGREMREIHREAVAWCRDQFGRPSQWREKPRWRYEFPWIMFGDDTRATAFKLRWYR